MGIVERVFAQVEAIAVVGNGISVGVEGDRFRRKELTEVGLSVGSVGLGDEFGDGVAALLERVVIILDDVDVIDGIYGDV